MPNSTNTTPRKIPPPSKHQLAIMIWLCVFPTLTALNLAFGDQLRTLSPVPRTFVLATIAVPIVIYGLMPQLHRARTRILSGPDKPVGRSRASSDVPKRRRP
jgi:antibiotic biosynthesis monooxygenase (ABM) superfamily enzyme